MGQGDVVRFRCEGCGLKIRVPAEHAGKKARCPKCKNIIVIPQCKEDSNSPKIVSRPLLDPAVFDIPQKTETADKKIEDVVTSANQADSCDAKTSVKPVLDTVVFESLPKPEPGDTKEVEYRKIAEEPPPKRKFPWFVDIFLYPMNVPGLTILGVFTGIPLFFHIFMQLLLLFTNIFPPAVLLFALVRAVNLIISIVLPFYFYWYLAECVRGTADGELRAPDTIGTTPGTIGEIFGQTLKILVCLLFFFAPVLIYFFMTVRAGLQSKPPEYSEWPAVASSLRSDKIFWLLLSYGIFFFPMGLLSVVMFDSINGLNPILLIGSIYNTFLQYCGLILFFYAFGYLIMNTHRLLWSIFFIPQVWFYVSRFITSCLFMTMAHVLGRFYWRYQDKLKWEV